MPAIELKERIIAQIRDIDDEKLLEQISRWIDLESETNEIHVMSPREIEAVNEGLEQLRNGQWFLMKI